VTPLRAFHDDPGKPAGQRIDHLAAATRNLVYLMLVIGALNFLAILLVVWIDQRGQDRDARARGELSAARAETCRNLDHQNARLRAVLRSFDPDGRSEKITAAIKAFTPPTCKPPS
jgi:hypothetical protein